MQLSLIESEPGHFEGTLLPSLSKKKRGYSVAPSDNGTQPGDWKIVIWQGSELKHYLIEEADCIGYIGRRFLWLKTEDGEVYETHIGANFVAHKCTCTAGNVGRFLCKHVEVLFDAHHRGYIPPKPKE